MYIRTEESIAVHTLDEDGPACFSLPDRLPETEALQVQLLAADQLAVVIDRRKPLKPRDDESTEPEFSVLKLDPSGAILWERDVNLPKQKKSKQPARITNVLPAALPGISPLCAGVPMLIQFLAWPKETRERRIRQGMESGELPLVVATVLLKVVACAAAVFFLLGRRGLTLAQRLGWSSFALLGGVGAVLAIWAELLSEKRIPCPACGRKRPPSMPNCPHCAADWPAPARRDIDILAPRR